jgi:hypothetical protein
MMLSRLARSTIARLTLAGASAGLAAPALAAGPSLFDPARDMRVAEVRPGMIGYGLSVFHGNVIERFDVRVVSVLRNFNPKFDVVLITFSGDNLEHTSAIAGMSGSPIYLYDDQHRARLIGAFAYGWQLQKDPIAGVQPIEYMLKLPEGDGGGGSGSPAVRPAATDKSAGPGRWSIGDVRLPGLSPRAGAQPRSTVRRSMTGGDDATRLVPLATPLMVAGLPPRVLEQVGPLFAAQGWVPVQAGGGGTDDADDPIRPGSVLGVPLVSGDIDMSAIGTCTEVVDGHVLAFGHPLNGDGKVALPFAGGQIQGVIASLSSSFKIGSVSKVQGTLTQDQTVGIAGNLGPGPATVPVEVRVVYADGSEDQTYRFTVAQHPKLTPLLVATAMASAMTGNKELPAHHTVDYDLSLQFAGGQTVRVADAGVDLTAMDLFAAVGLPLVGASDNPFEQVPVRKITGTLRVSAEQRSAQILYATVPRSRYRPGEAVTAYVVYRPFHGDERTMPVTITLPHDLPDGTYGLTIADATKYLDDERTAEPFRFTAETATQVFDVLRDVSAIRRDAVYVRLLRQPDSVAVGHVAMAKLPGSRRQVLIGSGRSDVTPFASSSRVVVATDRVMTGSADFEITVDRNADIVTAAGR